MTQQQLATSRLVVTYTERGTAHEARAYSRGATKQGADWYINSRTLDANDVKWTDALQQLYTAVNSLMSNEGLFGPGRFERLVNGLWQVEDINTPNGVAGVGAIAVAAETMVVLRDRNMNKVKFVYMEGNQPAPQKLSFATGGNAAMDAFLAPFVSGAGNAADPFNWMVSKSNQYLTDSPFVSTTVSLNRKARRRRGLG